MIPPGNMRNIVSLVQENPRINIEGMAHALGLTPNGVKYHLKQLRKIIHIGHIGPYKAGHWEIRLQGDSEA